MDDTFYGSEGVCLSQSQSIWKHFSGSVSSPVSSNGYFLRISYFSADWKLVKSQSTLRPFDIHVEIRADFFFSCCYRTRQLAELGRPSKIEGKCAVVTYRTNHLCCLNERTFHHTRRDSCVFWSQPLLILSLVLLFIYFSFFFFILSQQVT